MTALTHPAPQRPRSRSELRHRTQAGTLRRIRRDVYAPHDVDAPTHQRHQWIRDALVAAVGDQQLDGVVAWEAAAIMHGGRTLYEPATVDLVVDWHPNGLRRRRGAPERTASRALGPLDRRLALSARPLVRHTYELAAQDVVELEGCRVTSLLRTTEDCARFLTPERALAVVDSLFAVAAGAGSRPWDRREQVNALAHGFRQCLLERLSERPRQRGVRQARAVVAAATPWSQSVWETEVRRLCLVSGIRAPEPQMPVRTGAGTRYVDNGWWEARRGHETDGEVKLAGDRALALEQIANRDLEVEAAGVRLLHSSPTEIQQGAELVEALRDFLPVTLCEERPVLALMTKQERRRAGYF